MPFRFPLWACPPPFCFHMDTLWLWFCLLSQRRVFWRQETVGAHLSFVYLAGFLLLTCSNSWSLPPLTPLLWRQNILNRCAPSISVRWSMWGHPCWSSGGCAHIPTSSLSGAHGDWGSGLPPIHWLPWCWSPWLQSLYQHLLLVKACVKCLLHEAFSVPLVGRNASFF